MKVFLLFLSVVVAYNGQIVNSQNATSNITWTEFRTLFKNGLKDVTNVTLHMDIFKRNQKLITDHNTLFKRGQVSFNLTMNKFGDMTPDEIRKSNGLLRPDKVPLMARAPDVLRMVTTFPPSLDYRSTGAVSSVKTQGSCGSCYSFAAAGALEGDYFRRTGKLLDLSPQNIVDCSSSYGNDGCNGGLPQYAYNYVKQNMGIALDSKYKYTGKTNSCQYNNSMNSNVTLTSYVSLPRGNETILKQALLTYGPVSVGIDASLDSFYFYSSGIYTDTECKNQFYDLNHAVLLVGYGKSNGVDYWIVKNSWGTEWGIKGYMYLAMNKNNLCGIATEASYPIL